jgi:hypothetical protein
MEDGSAILASVRTSRTNQLSILFLPRLLHQRKITSNATAFLRKAQKGTKFPDKGITVGIL